MTTTYDASNAECWVYSYKEGLLSKIAHDLKHRVTRFKIHVDPARSAIEAEIDASSLRVDCVMKDGRESRTELTGDDKGEIEDQIVNDVLNADVHPLIRFRSTSIVDSPDGVLIQGDIQLNDVTHPIGTVARRQQDHYVAEFTIHQPAFGIKPYSAMLGALKIKADVVVRVLIPAT